MSSRVVIGVGVPVWRGATFIGETLRSILQQRDVSLIVLVSIDGADAMSAKACRPFLADSRVRLVVQKHRLGWVQNSAMVLAAALAEGVDYACIQPHDDIIDEYYLAELLGAAEANPAAAVTYSDLRAFGKFDFVLGAPSVVGSPVDRGLALLLEHVNALAYRGLTRASALRAIAPISENPFDDFAADTVWTARLARVGDLIRVPRVLYRKRYHDGNEHDHCVHWPDARKVEAWTWHCLDMLAETLKFVREPAQRRLLHAAARKRLLQQGVAIGPFHHAIMAMESKIPGEMLRRFDSAAALRTDIGPSEGAPQYRA